MIRNKSVGNNLTLLNRYTKIYFMDALAEFDLHGPGQLRIVLTLGEHKKGMTQEELAKKLIVDKAAVSRMIRPLIQNGIIERTQHPEDRRAYTIKLTEKFQDKIPEIQEKAWTWTDILTRGLSDDEIVQLLSLLEKLEINARCYLNGEKSEQ